MKNNCSKCGVERCGDNFIPNSNICRSCKALYKKSYRELNIEKITQYNTQYLKEWSKLNKDRKKNMDKQYYLNNLEKFVIYRKNYYQVNKKRISIEMKDKRLIDHESTLQKEQIYRKSNKGQELIRDYYRNRRANDIDFRIRTNLRNRVRQAIRGNSNSESTMTLLGCSISELKIYLESKFLPTMTWENYGKLWHIDHIVPISIFDLSISENRHLACHYTNLQPLFAKTLTVNNVTYIGNLNKSNIYENNISTLSF